MAVSNTAPGYLPMYIQIYLLGQAHTNLQKIGDFETAALRLPEDTTTLMLWKHKHAIRADILCETLLCKAALM